MILLTDRRGKLVQLACGCRRLHVEPVVGTFTRRCDICHAVTEVEVRRSDLQAAYIVTPRTIQPKDTP